MDSVLNNIKNSLGEDVQIETFRPEDGLSDMIDSPDLVFSMGQGGDTLEYVEKLKVEKGTVVNSVSSIKNCYRADLYEKLAEWKIPHPMYYLFNTIEELSKIVEKEWENGLWYKRGDFHAVDDSDVKQFTNVETFKKFYNSSSLKQKGPYILQKHEQGELFKFYGVQNSFLSFRYMGEAGPDRYDLKSIEEQILSDEVKLQVEKMVHKIAVNLDLDVFGGDFILNSDGEIFIIDFNDWPSFRTCRDEAAVAISNYSLSKLMRH
jgi:hypothetical protein